MVKYGKAIETAGEIMIKRDTMPLPVIREITGVIGMAPGSGVTFICELLENGKHIEMRKGRAEENHLPAIVDMSESESDTDAERVLIVADCTKGEMRNLRSAINRYRRMNFECAVVLNRWREGIIIPKELEEDRSLKIIKIPEIDGDMIRGLYNFAFYSR